MGWALGDRGAATARVLQQQLPPSASAAHIEYCTDHHRPYLAVLAGRRHTVGKAHTHHIESLNNKLRCYLARLRRKTHAYSKSAQALRDALLFIWRRKFGAVLQPQVGCIESTRLWDEPVQIPI
ncbi:IS1 family transposase [Acidovorax sp. NCPPB 4044]|uniref:IS1 family transposase n=1 Tax=Acidovorax sp. NCPPB 4044 TaxID=2940490 RepID=UPI0023034DC7|nr:IS1 family transposase [Acidovorax sp. NCPPB 4044]MDA8522688.1 IS1 family transposase [Acidovorax sp. NCPPB 4044]MDA8522860.1 IS1 family transposase [Acidovorax sp. NCPPB 4044]MDA8523505.1 IS1 family transposase [Acidovorax sp. NCPPB 4044]MDA8523684.1 IS1 family transposase [Acidovorax sp. NCPPB 4044]